MNRRETGVGLDWRMIMMMMMLPLYSAFATFRWSLRGNKSTAKLEHTKSKWQSWTGKGSKASQKTWPPTYPFFYQLYIQIKHKCITDQKYCIVSYFSSLQHLQLYCDVNNLFFHSKNHFKHTNTHTQIYCNRVSLLSLGQFEFWKINSSSFFSPFFL